MAGCAMAKRERPAAKQVVSADWRADLVAAESGMFRGATYDWPDAFYFIEHVDIYIDIGFTISKKRLVALT